MSDDAWKIIVFVCATTGGTIVGGLIDSAKWRADCEAMNMHMSGSQVYECKPRSK